MEVRESTRDRGTNLSPIPRNVRPLDTEFEYGFGEKDEEQTRVGEG